VIPPKLPPRPGSHRDERTPPEGLTGRRSLQEHDEALGRVAIELAGLRTNCGAHLVSEQQLRNAIEKLEESDKKREIQVAELTAAVGKPRPIKVPWTRLIALATATISSVFGGSWLQTESASARTLNQAGERARQAAQEAQRLESDSKTEKAVASALVRQREEFQRWYHQLELEREKAQQARVAAAGGKR
jgi:hypothetical protein